MVDQMCENCKPETKEPCYCEKGICSAKDIRTKTRCSECGHLAWPEEKIRRAI